LDLPATARHLTEEDWLREKLDAIIAGPTGAAKCISPAPRETRPAGDVFHESNLMSSFVAALGQDSQFTLRELFDNKETRTSQS
jgi:hypothetical protein